MSTQQGYHNHQEKAQKVTNEGRTVLYPNGLVTFQPRGMSHSEYAKGTFGK